MINQYFQIIVPSTPMMRQPNNNSTMDTECLFGEKIKVLKKLKNWVFCELTTDKYEGWIKTNKISKLINSNSRILALRTFVRKKPDVKSNLITYLPIGAKIFTYREVDDWMEIILPFKKKIKGYIPKNHIVNLSHKVDDWVKIAESFIGTPYHWGGRDSVGIDCSALLQLSLATVNINLPRDTYLQNSFKFKQFDHDLTLKRGTIVFWEGHVGIMVNSKNILHANAFHMTTLIESFSIVKKRLYKQNSEIIKILNIKI